MKANPTVCLFAGLGTWFCVNLYIAIHRQHLGWGGGAVLFCAQSLVVFTLYIVVHDCAHRSASRNRLLNDAMLGLCGVIYLFDAFLYRRIHLTHHAHTNELVDPDHFTSSRLLALRWLKSFLIGPAYYGYAIKHFRTKPNAAAHLLFSPVLLSGLFTAFSLAHHQFVFVAGWLLPAFVSMGLLGFVLTAWPHHPAEDTSRIGNAKNLDVPRVLQWLLGNQHLHLVHHYAPTVPWYRLPAYWRDQKQTLVTQGARPVP